ncbi:MAG TPA: glycosyl hydrolase family 18 protein, partial [Gemmatimonadaceae bacterium]|nr:glycosyl hydrolase family 18 protein [Gemmatimonadaceae bacterium]
LAVVALIAAARPCRAQAVESIWYSTSSEQSTQSFLAHADRISTVAPQVFAMDAAGTIRGHVDPRLLATARAKHVKVVPLVMNPGFDQGIIHRVLTDAGARRRALADLRALCAENHFDGIQFDIENVNVGDRDALTSFMGAAVPLLHGAGCSVSAAVVPRTSDDPGPTAFHRWIFTNWRGAYDYKKLADTLDFISYMTYAEHTGGTTPGPVAGYAWMEQALQFALSLGVAPDKLSLGIPSYSDWWYTTYDTKHGEHARGSDIGYARAADLLRQHNARTTWDDTAKSPWAMWSNEGAYEYLWMEDARAFAAKLALVKQYHLRGYSVWVLGLEDPEVWSVVPPR